MIQERLCTPEGIECYQNIKFNSQPSSYMWTKENYPKKCLVECQGTYADVFHGPAEMIEIPPRYNNYKMKEKIEYVEGTF